MSVRLHASEKRGEREHAREGERGEGQGWRRRWWWWRRLSLLVKIEGDPINTQHAQLEVEAEADGGG